MDLIYWSFQFLTKRMRIRRLSMARANTPGCWSRANLSQSDSAVHYGDGRTGYFYQHWLAVSLVKLVIDQFEGCRTKSSTAKLIRLGANCKMKLPQKFAPRLRSGDRPGWLTHLKQSPPSIRLTALPTCIEMRSQSMRICSFQQILPAVKMAFLAFICYSHVDRRMPWRTHECLMK